MKQGLRRIAILALVLVLLCSNTMRASASTEAPSVTVSSYVALYTALEKAKDGDVIGIKGAITIPSPDALEYASVTLKRMEAGAKLIFADTYGYGGTSTVKYIEFDGNSTSVSGTEPFVVISGDVSFSMCEFINCFYEGGNGGDINTGTKGGAVYIGSGSVSFSSCRFDNNCADYGAGLFNNGTVTIDNSTFEGNWAEETGGAIYNAGTLTMRNTKIIGNTARMGGGLYSNASTELYNSLIWNNTASIHGSDIANEGSLSDYTTEAEYNALLNCYSLYYGGWENELDTSIGGTGEYKKLLATDTDPNAPTEPEPTDPPDTEEPDEGDNTGGEDEGTTTPDPDTGDTEEPTTPDGGEEPTDPPTPPDESGDSSGDAEDPSDTGKGDTIDNSTTDNSVTDNSDHSATDNSTTDNSDHSSTDNSQSSTDNSSTDNSAVDNSSTDNSTVDNSVTDNSQQSSTDNSTVDNSQSNTTTDNSQHSSTTDNSSVVSNTDNSSSKSESSNTENSNNTTTYNYYQTEQDKGSGAPQSISQPITVNVTVPQAKEPETGTQEPTEASQSIAQNIHIEAEGVNVKYEYTADGVSISISPYIAPESSTEAEIVPTAIPTVATPQEPTESPISWVEYVSMILLAVLVLAEIRDLILKKRAK